DEKMCCNDCDCGLGICYEGFCEESNTPSDTTIPVFSSTVDPETASFVRYLYTIKNSVKGETNMCAGFIMLLLDKKYTNKELLGITGHAWDMLANMMNNNKNQIICQYRGATNNCNGITPQPGDFVFFRNPKVPSVSYWSDITSVCYNMKDNYKFCDYSYHVNIRDYPITTHVAIYGGSDFLFDQWGSDTNRGTLSGRITWAGYVTAIIRPDYSKLNRRR
ncbi:MAG: hypothetical protein V1870_05750, partial [Candidatus Aenigmatarchaeota archaeon]